MSRDWRETRILFRFNGVAVKVKPSFWPMWLSGWPLLIGLAKRRRPERSWLQSILLGTAGMPWPIIADLGHALAHTVSAKLAGAPMDEIHLAADMPRTIYFNNDVTPDQHRLRALGGPIFRALSLGISLVWRSCAPPETAARELAEISAVSQALIFCGSLLPMAIVDGGTLLKWTLVDRGRTEGEAERQVRRTSWWAAVGLIVAAVSLLYQALLRMRTR